MTFTKSQSVTRKFARFAVLAVVLGLTYAAIDIGLNRFGFGNGWTILWPLNGVTIAILTMNRRSDWPAMLLGIAVGTGFGECVDHNPLMEEVILRTFSITEIVISASLLPPFASLERWLRRPRIFLRFVAALLLGPGTTGIMAAVYFHYAHGQEYLRAFNDWATADALGIAATMPLVLALRSPEMRALFRPRALLRTLWVLLLSVSATILCFSVSRYPLLFLIYPTLLLVDSMLEFAGSAIAMSLVCFISVYLTTTGHGPFGVWTRPLLVSSDVALQIFLGFQVLALFPASVFFMERRRMSEELRSTNAQLLMLASLDGLTGIANRRSLDERFGQEWKRAIRLKTPLALMMIDIDHFKQFNDEYGHHAGDQCLRAVADALTAMTRRVQDHVARFGGEEFALLLPHTDLEGAVHMANKIRLAVLDLEIAHRGSSWQRVTVSIGCSAIIPEVGGEQFDLLMRADEALYLAKAAGRNCVQSSALVEVAEPQIG